MSGTYGLEGRVGIVTGATRGLGLVVTRRLLDEGTLVVASGLTPASCARLEATFAEQHDRIEVVAQDMRLEDAGARLVDAAMARWGHLDLVVNNAAPFAERGADRVPGRADWIEIFSAKLLGYWGLMTAAIPALTETRGAITNVAGGAGLVAAPASPHVGAINAAIVHMTDSYALKLARSGVRVNAVIPSVIDNDRFATRAEARARERGVTVEEARAELADRVPAGFPTSPEEIASVILLLSSPSSRSITGAHVVVGGASHLQGHGRPG